jgi:hypothetical protein
VKKLVLVVTVGLFLVALVAFVTENHFLLGLSWFNPGKSNLADVQRLLGNRYEPEGFIHKEGVSGHSRIYFVHVGSFILATYEIDFFPGHPNEPEEKWISDADTSLFGLCREIREMSSDILTDHPPVSPKF